ncbi:MAG: hypothetical protein IPO87_14650 [Flavobacteriales bacterium]|nr:hypothetical protein [Flavobacteriales bacterium]
MDFVTGKEQIPFPVAMYRTLTLCIALFLGPNAFAQRGTVAGTTTANEGE